MRLIRKISATALIVMALGLIVGGVLLSHTSGPGTAPPLAANAERMQAIVYRQYGSAAVLRLEQVARPVPKADELLIKVHDAALNPLDWHMMEGAPYVVRLSRGLGRPSYSGMGVDFSGTVEAVGPNVKAFKVGDELFGTADGALAEYVTSTEVGLALKPSTVTFTQAAALPIAGITALQALRDKGQLKPGQKVLINGASGGVGTFAVQIAKTMGAEVTGVCSTRNLQLVRSLGADHVIDYTQQDFMQGPERYDLVFDAVGNQPLLHARRILKEHGIFVIVGGSSSDRWLGPLDNALKIMLITPFIGQKYTFFMADANQTRDLDVLRDMMQTGKLRAVIDKEYPLSETPEAMRYLEAGHARGKVIVSVQQ